MIQKSKKVKLEWKLNPSSFSVINSEVIGEATRKLGSNVSVVNKMIERSEEMKAILPSVLGYDSNSNNINWTDLVRKYWSGMSIQVPPGGVELEAGFSYDIHDPRKKDAIKSLMKEQEQIKTEEDLVNFVESSKNGVPNVHPDEKYKYATPINPEEYVRWKYAYHHREVANNLEDVNKSRHIRFYLYTEEEIKQSKVSSFNLSKQAMSRYLEILGDRAIVDSVLYALGVNIDNMEDLDKDMTLKTRVDGNPKEFLDVTNDPNLKTRALIERLIISGILRRLPGSTIIVDSNDPSIVVGNTYTEAITYFSPENSRTKAQASEYITKYKALRNINTNVKQ